MAYEMTSMSHVGSPRPFNHNQSQAAEQEYDRLRDLARQEASKRSSCLDSSKQAYAHGDGQLAHQLSEEGKAHGAQMAAYNKQASDFIFRENNTPGRVPPDTIDLHGQFVEEAEDILEQRIRAAKAQGQRHLHVIVGKGNHSSGHIQKIKPRVEQVCQQEGLQFHSEENEGRIYVDLTGGQVDLSQMQQTEGYQHYQRPYGGSGGGGGYQGDGLQQQGYQQPQQPQYGQYQGQAPGQGQDEDVDVEKLAKKFCSCCIVM